MSNKYSPVRDLFDECRRRCLRPHTSELDDLKDAINAFINNLEFEAAGYPGFQRALDERRRVITGHDSHPQRARLEINTE